MLPQGNPKALARMQAASTLTRALAQLGAEADGLFVETMTRLGKQHPARHGRVRQ